MSTTCIPFVLGPLENNTYLIVDSETNEAAIIDPSFESEIVLSEIKQQGWRLTQVWLTHAHFDHIAGVRTVAESVTPPLPVGLHPGDLILWKQSGGAPPFGIKIDRGPEPSILFTHGQRLQVGKSTFEVRHTPGHTRGHVVFVCHAAGFVLSGDLIFKGSVGRTDLPGGDSVKLINSIRSQILDLPPETRIFSGHGPETTVGEEIKTNPCLI